MYKFLFLLSFLNIACSSTKGLPEPISIERGESNGEDILFVLYTVTKTDGIPSVKMNTGMIKAGKLKEEMKSTARPNDNEIFILEAINDSKELIKTFYFTNPLVEKVEYLTDDEGGMAVDEIEYDQKELIIRMNVEENLSSLQLYFRQPDNSKRKLLHSINIQ